MGTRNVFRVFGTALAGLLLAVGCGGQPATPSVASSGGPLSSNDGLKEATAIYNAALTPNTTFPTAPGRVTIGKHKVAVVAAGLATIGASATAKYVQEAIAAAGWTAPPTYDGKFQATVESGLIEQAVNGGAEGLVLIAITPSTVASAVNLAASKNLPIVCILCGPTPSAGTNANIVNIEPSPDKTGQLQAVFPIVKSKGKASIVVYHDDEYDFTAKQIASAVSTLQRYCSGCKLNEQQMRSGDQLKPGIPILTSVLTQNPKGTIDYIIAPFDSASQPFAALAHQLGRDEIGVVGYSATPNFASLIKDGNPPGAVADVTIPLPYMGWSAVDLMARSFAKSPLWAADQMPVGLLTRENYSQYPADEQFLQPKGDFRSAYKALWQ